MTPFGVHILAAHVTLAWHWATCSAWVHHPRPPPRPPPLCPAWLQVSASSQVPPALVVPFRVTIAQVCQLWHS